MATICCQRPVLSEKPAQDTDEIKNTNSDSTAILNSNDCFTVVYEQKVHGYQVKATVGFDDSFFFILPAQLTFTKDEVSFTLNTKCFGDTMFCKGRLDYDSQNPVLFRKYRNKEVRADYHKYIDPEMTMPLYTPFFFMDLDFDGIEELVVVHKSMAVRYHDGYDVYRIVDGKPILIDYPPYNDNSEDWGFGMTDYPQFDFSHKTITCPYPEGELSYLGQIVYGISKKQKDTVIVNGREHHFNHLEPIKKVEYKRIDE